MLKISVKIAALALVLWKFGPAEAKLFNASEYRLDNGMQVVVVPNHKAPIVKHMVWYKVGSADEKPGKGGVAHLLEHLMFRGTKLIKGTELNRITENNGMEANAFTGQDYTAYHQLMDISRLELAMFMEADRMRNLNFSDEDFELERDIVYQERKQVVENNPASVFAETMRKVLWQDHPYARPVTGSVEEIRSLKPEDARAFYKRYYAPNNAILVLSGDIEPGVGLKLAEKYYGEAEAFDGLNKNKIKKPAGDFAAVFEMEVPTVNSVRLSNIWLAPSVNSPDKRDIYALSVLSKYLGEGKTSKLYKKLVTEKKLALAVDSSYDYAVRGIGTFTLSAMPKEGVSAQKMQQALNLAVREALDEITLDEIASTKRRMLAGLVYLKDNPGDAAMIIGSMMSAGMTLEEIEALADSLSAVDYKDVKAAGEKLLLQKPRVAAVLKPKSGEGK